MAVKTDNNNNDIINNMYVDNDVVGVFCVENSLRFALRFKRNEWCRCRCTCKTRHSVYVKSFEIIKEKTEDCMDCLNFACLFACCKRDVCKHFGRLYGWLKLDIEARY